MRIFDLSYVLFLLFVLALSCSSGGKEEQETSSSRFYTMEDYDQVSKIDAHVHIRSEGSDFMERAREDNFRLLTVVVDEDPGIALQEEHAVLAAERFPDVVAFATTISVSEWSDQDWEEQTLHRLSESLDRGAIGVKVYKNIGMELRDDAGDFVMIDHPRFRPVFQFLSDRNIPVIGHLGEPRNCWLPVEEMTVESDKRYFTRHPEFHMYLHPEYPSYEDQINARDQILVTHADLWFVGAHLGSLEWSVDELAARLDRFPRMAVDLAARISSVQYLTREDRDKVRDFFIKYQDRLIYGSDRIVDDARNPEQSVKDAQEIWRKDWEFFCTDHRMTSGAFEGEFQGLRLPSEVIDKLYRKNAEAWFRPMAAMADEPL